MPWAEVDGGEKWWGRRRRSFLLMRNDSSGRLNAPRAGALARLLERGWSLLKWPLLNRGLKETTWSRCPEKYKRRIQLEFRWEYPSCSRTMTVFLRATGGHLSCDWGLRFMGQMYVLYLYLEAQTGSFMRPVEKRAVYLVRYRDYRSGYCDTLPYCKQHDLCDFLNLIWWNTPSYEDRSHCNRALEV